MTSSVSWKLTNAPWIGRYYFAAVTDVTGVTVMGGFASSKFNDVWYMSGTSECCIPDYSAWCLKCSAANWTARNGHAVTLSANIAVMTGGYDGNYFCDTWASVAPYR